MSALNVHRRHLDSSQKSVVAVKIEEYLSIEAKQRQREAQVEAGKNYGRGMDSSPQIIADTYKEKNRDNESAVKAAKIVGPLKVINIQNICRFCLTDYGIRAITL